MARFSFSLPCAFDCAAIRRLPRYIAPVPRTALFLVVAIPLFGLIIAAHIYAYRRFVRDLTQRRWIRGAAIAFLWVMALLALSLRGISHLLPITTLRPISLTVQAWLGLFLYATGVRAALDLVSWIARRMRSRGPAGISLEAAERAAPASRQSPPPIVATAAPRRVPAGAPAEVLEHATLGGSIAALDPAAAPVSARPATATAVTRRTVLSASLAAGAAAAGGGIAAFGVWRAFTPPQITEVPVRLPNLPKALEGFTIVQLTDIHVGGIIQRHFLDELVARANAQSPDLLAITGDLVDGTPEQLGRFVAAFGNLRAKRGRYFVTGNHDYYSGADQWVQVVRGLGIDVLRNRRVTIGDAGGSFQLAGVDDWSSRREGKTGSVYDLDAALEGLRPDQASVLLAHQPMNLEEVSRRGVGLQLSGHTHGGQMFPVTALAGLFYGDRNTGLSRLGDTHFFVSRGCGFVGPPMRVGAPPEIVKLVLLPA